jgi:predicted phage baseplate assembly protein
MSWVNDDSPLDPCDCCEGLPAPPPRTNRPGLPEIAYRLGTYGSFLTQLLAQLSHFQLDNSNSLRALKTRSPEDATIALLDAWAIVADVLTFYQERIANEGYLRTATERRSILELARAIGYELNPGVAASVYLAFTVEDTPQSPKRATIPAGTQIQSIPTQEQLPQTFETAIAFAARAEWNQLRPRLTQPQTLLQASTLYIAGTPRLNVGDFVAIVESGTPIQAQAKQIIAIAPEPERQRTRIVLDRVERKQPPPQRTLDLSPRPVTPTPQRFNQANIDRLILNQTLRESDLSALVSIQGWNPNSVVFYSNQPASTSFQLSQTPAPSPTPAPVSVSAPSPTPTPLPPPQPGLYHFKTRTNPFGHNAPRWDSLPLSQRYQSAANTEATSGGLTTPTAGIPIPFPASWDDGNEPSITVNSRGTARGDVSFYCDRPIPEIIPGSLILLEQTQVQPYQVQSTRETSLADFALTAKATGLTVTPLPSLASSPPSSSAPPPLTDYKLRTTTIHAISQPLPLAELDLEADLGAGTPEAQQLTLNALVLGLQQGQAVALTGELRDPLGVPQTEIVFLKEIIHSQGLTTLQFTQPLSHRYVRATVTLNANTVLATHGETAVEVLGSGDATQPNQTFKLKKPPLTYRPASTASGAESSLSVRVNGILWAELPAFYGLNPTAEGYIVRIEDDGTTRVIFGDGKQGARLPSGMENAIATYRSGIGAIGEVPVKSISLLKKRPLGIQSVTNPLRASGAENPESLTDARSNAPLTVLTLDRIVSRQDYEDFARAFAGIGKAQAVALWDGKVERVHITVATASGELLSQSDKTLMDLKAAIESLRDRTFPFLLDSFDPRYFNLKARVLADPRYVPETLLAQIETRLKTAFAFAQRNFAEGVSAAEVVTSMQQVAGVIAVDLKDFYTVVDPTAPGTASLSSYLDSAIATWNPATQQANKAQLLLINPGGIELEVIPNE